MTPLHGLAQVPQDSFKAERELDASVGSRLGRGTVSLSGPVQASCCVGVPTLVR